MQIYHKSGGAISAIGLRMFPILVPQNNFIVRLQHIPLRSNKSTEEREDEFALSFLSCGFV